MENKEMKNKPKYKTINYEFIKEFKFIKYYYVDISWRKQYCGILEYEK